MRPIVTVGHKARLRGNDAAWKSGRLKGVGVLDETAVSRYSRNNVHDGRVPSVFLAATSAAIERKRGGWFGLGLKSVAGARVRRGVTLERTKNGVGCWLKRVARIRTASRKFREPFSAFLEIFLPPLVGVYSVARRNQTPRPPTSKANIWSHATKNSRPANRRVDLFPYDAAFFAIFFFFSSVYRLLPQT